MKRLLLITALAANYFLADATAAESIYTPTTGSNCRNASEKQHYSALRCLGPAGYAALLLDEGNLAAVSIGPVGRERTLVSGDLQWIGADRVFGDKIEWRLSDRKPYAAILRVWHNESDQTMQELLVIRVTVAGSCRVGAVNAQQRGANILARELADRRARTFQCGKDQPSLALN